MNTNEGVYLDSIEITNVKSFKDTHKFSFTNNGKWQQWTVLLGDNNVGKTNLLKLIACADPIFERFNLVDSTDTIYFLDYKYFHPAIVKEKIQKKEDHIVSELIVNYFSEQNKNNSISLSMNSGGAKGINSDDNSGAYKEISKISVFGYGTTRVIENTGLTSNHENNRNNENTKNLLYNHKLLNFEDWLLQLDYTSKSNELTPEIIKTAKNRKELLIDLFISEIFPEIQSIRFASNEKLNNFIEYESNGKWLRFYELGYGYQTTLSWVLDFCKKLFDKYPISKNPFKEPAILLVDEIDLHLHPSWQRNITKYLSDIFTSTQFVVTTHSPFVLQSLENVNLFLLRSVGKNIDVKLMENVNFIGWSVEEILSEIMELKSDINTDTYQQLVFEFNLALDEMNKLKAEKAYNKLLAILHPNSVERKLFKIQLSQVQ